MDMNLFTVMNILLKIGSIVSLIVLFFVSYSIYNGEGAFGFINLLGGLLFLVLPQIYFAWFYNFKK